MFHLEKYGIKERLIYCALILFSMVAYAVFLTLPPAALGADQAVVKGSVVNLRAAPTTGSGIVDRAQQGQALEVLGKQGDWYQVVNNGKTCWVAGWLVEPKPAANSGAPAAPAGENTSYRAEITENNVNIRSGPGTTYSVTGQAAAGNKYSLLDRSGDWYKISAGGGSGWVYGQFVKLLADNSSRGPAGNSGWAVANDSNINIRSGPGTGYQVVSRASRGERFMLADRSSDWYKIILDNGGSGWIASWLVEVDRNAPGNSTPASDNPSGNTTPASDNPSGNTTPAGGNTPNSPPPPGDNTSGGGQGVILPPAPKDTGKDARGKPAVTLKSVSARVEGNSIVITVQSTEPISYSVSSLWDPDRLVIDIKDQAPGTVPGSISLSSPLAGGIRVGWYSRDPDITRIVVDLKGRVRYEKILSPDGRQLRVVLAPRTSCSLSGAKIVLDPGHGGSDPGAIGPSGLKEKDVNLDIAQKAAQYLKKQGAKVILTRTGDTYVDLYERPNIANKNGATLFLSIHSNSNPGSDANGTSTYHLRSPIEGIDQARLDGMYLARYVQSALLAPLRRPDRGVLQADFAVLTKSRVPAALVEVAFISNPEEEKMLGDGAFRSKVAQAVAQGIADFLAAK